MDTSDETEREERIRRAVAMAEERIQEETWTVEEILAREG